MKELQGSLDSMDEAKKVSLGHKIEALQQLILLRYQALTTISGIGFAVIGIFISIKSGSIQDWPMTLASFVLLTLIAIVSLGRYLVLVRKDINGITQKIKDLPKEDWSEPLEEKDFTADYWPESLYALLVIGIIIFAISLF
jgi:drug/metabolite transporter (DMT)-like permease